MRRLDKELFKQFHNFGLMDTYKKLEKEPIEVIVVARNEAWETDIYKNGTAKVRALIDNYYKKALDSAYGRKNAENKEDNNFAQWIYIERFTEWIDGLKDPKNISQQMFEEKTAEILREKWKYGRNSMLDMLFRGFIAGIDQGMDIYNKIHIIGEEKEPPCN